MVIKKLPERDFIDRCVPLFTGTFDHENADLGVIGRIKGDTARSILVIISPFLDWSCALSNGIDREDERPYALVLVRSTQAVGCTDERDTSASGEPAHHR